MNNLILPACMLHLHMHPFERTSRWVGHSAVSETLRLLSCLPIHCSPSNPPPKPANPLAFPLKVTAFRPVRQILSSDWIVSLRAQNSNLSAYPQDCHSPSILV